MALDLAMSHPSQGIIANQARGDTTASERAALAKVDENNDKCATACANRGVDFLPVILCAFGGRLAPAEDLLSKLASRLAERTGIQPAIASMQLWQLDSTNLWRGNARMIWRHAAPHWQDSQWAAAAVRDPGPRRAG